MFSCVDNFCKCHSKGVVAMQRGGFGIAFERRTLKGIVATRDVAYNIKTICSVVCDERDADGNIKTKTLREKKDVANFLKYVFPTLQCDAVGKTRADSAATMAILYLSSSTLSYTIKGYIY
jgi:hypothetical protein